MWTSPPLGVREHSSGRARWTMPDGRVFNVTRLPLFDTMNGVFARLTYKQALSAAAALGGRLLERDEVDDIWRRGVRTRPVELWKPGTGAEMMSLEWARRHDQGVLPQLEGWDGKTPVASVGKDYLRGAPPGRQRFYGWHRANGVPIQNDTTNQHNDQYSDYSQATRIAWDVSGPTGVGGSVGGSIGSGVKPPFGSAAGTGDDEGGAGLSGTSAMLLMGGLVLGGIILMNHLGDR